MQLENLNENSICNKIEIGKKVYENNGNWEITKIEECGWNEKKKKWFVRLRDELTVKNRICTFMRYGIKWMEI